MEITGFQEEKPRLPFRVFVGVDCIENGATIFNDIHRILDRSVWYSHGWTLQEKICSRPIRPLPDLILQKLDKIKSNKADISHLRTKVTQSLPHQLNSKKTLVIEIQIILNYAIHAFAMVFTISGVSSKRRTQPQMSQSTIKINACKMCICNSESEAQIQNTKRSTHVVVSCVMRLYP